MPAIDIVLLSNGPGEITTWVRPVVKALRRQLGHDRQQVRLSLVLSPCPNASGQEVAIAQRYPELDRIQGAEHFLPFLLWGKTAANWDWRSHGIVIFLGGDQFYTVVIGKRLGYKTLVYSEWETRWHRWIDGFATMNADLVQQAPPAYAAKFTVVGDLMAEARQELQVGTAAIPSSEPLIGLLPGSKPAKLAQGVPLGLAVAQIIHAEQPQTRFVIPVAPTLDLPTLARFANPATNPVLQQFGDVSAALVWDEQPYLQMPSGLRILLWTAFPAYEVLVQCQFCYTTVGANTAELGSLAVPMIVLVPTQQLDAMRAWDGLPGLLANLPGVGSVFAKLINQRFLRQPRLLAWPNIWAGTAIVPELIGELQPQAVAELGLALLNDPSQLAHMRQQLRQVRGATGAAQRLAERVADLLDSSQQSR
ncbi:MAG: lipid-A-disaccharide synthase [Synechococcales cyanobacterium C42_A2020_086]|jgi:lipid-A-disaccharide synthase|nr:lipid-A-disaccharide synthase [Synechococcales cyanobacterium C42_A2020_086]